MAKAQQKIAREQKTTKKNQLMQAKEAAAVVATNDGSHSDVVSTSNKQEVGKNTTWCIYVVAGTFSPVRSPTTPLSSSVTNKGQRCQTQEEEGEKRWKLPVE